VSGLDFAAEVVATARRNVAGVEFTEGDAQELPYGDGTFDRVLCGYGIIHMPEPDRAIAEMLRVLISGGRAALSVWAGPASDNGFGLLFGAVKQHGRLDVPLPHGPDFFQFSDPAAMREILSGLGFIDVAVRTVDQFWDFASPGDLINAILAGAVRFRALLKAQEPSVLTTIRKEVEAGMEAFRSGGTYRVPMPATIGAGTKP
jgi:SAM-dependent methyltransferase